MTVRNPLMSVIHRMLIVIVAVIASVTLVGGASSTAAPAAHDHNPLHPDGRCVVDPEKPSVTVDSLRFHCTPEQADELFLKAESGSAPVGRQRFWVLPAVTVVGQLIPYPLGRAWSSSEQILGNALTFTDGPQRQWVFKNYTIGGQDVGGPLKPGTSYVDGKPAWTIDFWRDFAGIPVSYHEFREIAPGVWLGWSYFLQRWNPRPELPIHGSYVITAW